MSTIDSTGISVDRLATIRTTLQTIFKASFGDDIKVGADSAFGQIIENIALTLHDQNELIEAVAGLSNPNSASGVNLASLVQLNGIDRNPNVFSYATVTCTSTKTITIPQDSIITDDNGIEWTTDADLTITGASTGDVAVTCSEEGAITAIAGAIDNISSPLDGWSLASNAAVATPGQAEETDAALRLRRQGVAARASTTSTSAIFQAVSEVDNVTETVVTENAGTTTDANGIPPQHVWVIVEGSYTDAEVAEAIYDHTGAGTGTVGETTVSHTDTTSGDTKDINFTAATDVTIDATVNVTITDQTAYDADGGAAAIQTAVASYINALTLGEDVERSRLYTPVNTVDGHTIDSILLGRNPAAATAADITMDLDEYAVSGTITVA